MIVVRCLLLTTETAIQISQHVALSLIDALLEKVSQSPSDSILILATSKIVQMPLIQEKGHYLFEKIIAKLKAMSPVQSKMNETAVFERLSPLLVLRTASLQTWKSLYHDEKLINEIFDLLLQRMTADTEFDDIRKISSELCSRLPLALTFTPITRQLQVRIG